MIIKQNLYISKSDTMVEINVCVSEDLVNPQRIHLHAGNTKKTDGETSYTDIRMNMTAEQALEMAGELLTLANNIIQKRGER